MPDPNLSGTVVSINVSERKGTAKRPVPEAFVLDDGLRGDAHAGESARQVSLLSAETIRRFSSETGRDTKPGEFAENITTEGLDLSEARLLDRIRCGEAELEIVQTGKECHGDDCAVFREVGRCVMPSEGIFCRVVFPGNVRVGDPVRLVPAPLHVLVVTVSDRAFRGKYEDRSGPEAVRILEEFCRENRLRGAISRTVIPDEPDALLSTLEQALGDGTAIVVSCGGTGIGPRDITPEAVLRFADKTIPGVMEAARVKFGADHPNALLSRSLAAVKGRMLIYSLPGSPRAVSEYLSEITRTLKHALFMLRGIDVH